MLGRHAASSRLIVCTLYNTRIQIQTLIQIQRQIQIRMQIQLPAGLAARPISFNLDSTIITIIIVVIIIIITMQRHLCHRQPHNLNAQPEIMIMLVIIILIMMLDDDDERGREVDGFSCWMIERILLLLHSHTGNYHNWQDKKTKRKKTKKEECTHKHEGPQTRILGLKK